MPFSPSPDIAGAPAPGFAAELRAATAALHVRAERGGILAELLRGRSGRAGYALLLRNLWPVYDAMEARLASRAAAVPWLAPFVAPGFARSAAIAADLATLAGGDWATRLPMTPAGMRYLRRIARAADSDGRLLAHAYVRVLGDLSGGQGLARVLTHRHGLEPAALQALSFPALPDLDAAKRSWRAALDAAGAHQPDRAAALREAQVAFRLNIALGEAVQQAARAAPFP